MNAIFYRWALVLGLLAGQVFSFVFAQDTGLERARKVYGQFVSGQGDSIYAELAQELQAKLSPAMFNNTFRQTEIQVGKLQSAGEWKTDTIQGELIYYSDLKFEHYNLRFLVAFNATGSITSIRLMPVPSSAVTKADPVTYDHKKMKERDIVLGADGFKLPGTLTLPLRKTKVPVVILVHGSGPNDRDETVGPNKPFRDIAWGLAEHGIAVIRYDKRTKVYGADFVSEGREADYDTEAVDDAVSAVAYAKTLSEVATDSIYVIGHSLGATLAPRIASRTHGLAGIVLIAGLARPLEDAIVEQTAYIASLSTSSAKEKEQLAELKREVDNVKKIGSAGFDDKIPLLFNAPRSYWTFANGYKPVEVAAKLSLPILVLQGERDYQVTMQDFGLWRMGLQHNRHTFFKSYPKLNHLLQEGEGKSIPKEYEEMSPVAAYVINDMATFIHSGRL